MALRTVRVSGVLAGVPVIDKVYQCPARTPGLQGRAVVLQGDPMCTQLHVVCLLTLQVYLCLHGGLPQVSRGHGMLL